MCRRQGTGRLDLAAQASRHCTLPGFDRGAWTGERLVRLYLGAPARYDLEGKRSDWPRPAENIEREGCPGAWYRTRFLSSLLTYYRRRDEHGGRIANPALDDCDDPLVHEAIAALELHEEIERGDYLDRKSRMEA